MPRNRTTRSGISIRRQKEWEQPEPVATTKMLSVRGGRCLWTLALTVAIRRIRLNVELGFTTWQSFGEGDQRYVSDTEGENLEWEPGMSNETIGDSDRKCPIQVADAEPDTESRIEWVQTDIPAMTGWEEIEAAVHAPQQAKSVCPDQTHNFWPS